MPSYVTVAVGLSLDKEFAYSVPEEWRSVVLPGMRVLVPFGRTSTTGYVTAVSDSTQFDGQVKPILELLDSSPTFTSHLLQFLAWVASYYHVPLGELMRKALPPSLHAQSRTIVSVTTAGRAAADRDPFLQALCKSGPMTLRRAQALVSLSSLRKQEGEGLLTIAKVVHRREPAAAFEQWVRLAALDKSRLSGPRQTELAAYLFEHPHVSLRALKQHFKNADRIVRILVEKGIASVERVRTWRAPGASFPAPPVPSELTAAQAAALARLESAIRSSGFQPFLLHGVTGSGKTEVYLRAADAALAAGKTALVLVPEIALTPQLMAIFQARFPGKIAILHSALGEGQRYDQWCRTASGDLPIVLGARSALFAPLSNLGLVVVDEEHEPSFKQDDRPFYNARDLALVRGMMAGSTVVLGSATPSLETFHNSTIGKLTALRLPERATVRPLPDVTIVDLRVCGFADTDRVVSKPLAAAIGDALETRHQVILFINRRGFASFLLCEACGCVPKCPNCAVSLTYHKSAGQLRCHYCLYAERVPPVCPVCRKEDTLQQIGSGTERAMESLAALFPSARCARLDSSVAGSTGNLTSILSSFRKGETDIIVGTQMIAKGHDFPGVTLVGVLNADLSLSFPDFRAAERTFQLLTQVAGRAGRGESPGRVLVQTYMPFHYVLAHAQRHDFAGFAAEELDQRRMRAFPPFSCLALVRLSSEDLAATQKCAQEAAECLNVCASRWSEVSVVGPTMAPLAYLRNRYRMQILLKAQERNTMARFLRNVVPVLRERLGRSKTVRWDVDVDPVNFM